MSPPSEPLLVVDTCLSACQAAVLDGARLHHRSEAMERGHQERLADMVGEVMDEAGLGFGNLGKVAVTVGPGSFTGLRVGLAFAKGLAQALDRPLVGIGALHALAAGRGGRIAAVLDARRDQVHLQIFEDGEAAATPEAVDIAEALRRLARVEPGRLVGPGAAIIARELPAWALEPSPFPDIAAVARLAAGLDPAGHPPSPLYLRGAYA